MSRYEEFLIKADANLTIAAQYASQLHEVGNEAGRVLTIIADAYYRLAKLEMRADRGKRPRSTTMRNPRYTEASLARGATEEAILLAGRWDVPWSNPEETSDER